MALYSIMDYVPGENGRFIATVNRVAGYLSCRKFSVTN